MCGRYASARSRVELLEEFGVTRDRVDADLKPDYNVAPTRPVYAVLTRPERDDEAIARELRVVRWGLVPSWAKDPSIGGRLINARAETVAEKPAFRAAFARRRCLLPADGYYEWQQPPAGTKGRKQPYFICRPDRRPLAFAGLYELWRDRSVPEQEPAGWLWTAAIITTTAPDELGEIHDRMPMVIDPDAWADWLDVAGTGVSDALALLAPAVTTGLISYPVSPAVNSVRNNGPDLIERAGPAPPGTIPAARSAGGAAEAGSDAGSGRGELDGTGRLW
ncbi:MAG: SOS response-associated peptidase [Streptosporangiaceae bacterium]